MNRFLFSLAFLLIGLTVSSQTTAAKAVGSKVPSSKNVTHQDTDSLRFKVGQMLVCGFNGVRVDEHIMLMVSRHFIGGVVLFDKNVSNNMGERNIRNPKQVNELISNLKDLSVGNLLVAIDQEGGQVARFRPAKGFAPSVSAKYLGEVDNSDTTRFWAKTIATQLSNLGVNLNFAPCVDLAVNPNNKIISTRGRAFSDSVDVVVRNASLYVEEHHKAGILTSLKHYPGHGSSTEDTHEGMTDITNTFSTRELDPYKEFIRSGYDDIVMMAHVIDMNVDSLPASLSKAHVDNLRNNIGYKGVIATDDLNMGAISNIFEYKKALELSINAGVDMIVIGNNGPSYRGKLIEITIIEILDLVNNGKISRSRIDEAYARIKQLKDRVN